MMTGVDTPMQEQVLMQPKYKSKYFLLGGIVLLLFLFPIVQLITDRNLNFYLNLMLLIFMYIVNASSWNIIGGYTGYISLGHNVFFAVGGYLTAGLVVHEGVPPILSSPLAGLVAMGIAFLVGLITLRVRGPAFIISTIALVLVFRIILDNWDLLGGATGLRLPLIDLPVQQVKFPFYYAFLILAIITVYSSYRIRHSKLGLALRAISQNETKAESAGIPTSYYKVLAFAISGFFVGVAGSLYGYYLTYVNPGIFLAILIGAKMVLVTILGGKGTVAGPVVGAVVFIIADQFFVSNFGASELNIFGTGLLMALVLIFFPEGIVGSLNRRGKLPGFLDWG